MAVRDSLVARETIKLTDDEGTFLALVVRAQPATAYQLSKTYAQSPVSNFGTSKGKIYPLIRRLKERGLLVGAPVEGDARGTETLEATARGREAVRQWVMHIRPSNMLPEDPLRTMMQSFDLLSRDEQREWIASARSGLARKLEELEAYRAEVTVPYHEQVHDNAVTAVRSRIEWLDRVRASLGDGPRRARRSSSA
jgi:DNA-binding PadR family transcriptional regulator